MGIRLWFPARSLQAVCVWSHAGITGRIRFQSGIKVGSVMAWEFPGSYVHDRRTVRYGQVDAGAPLVLIYGTYWS